MDKCPECGSDDKFYHCHERCFTPIHNVTCNNCKAPYDTTELYRDYFLRTDYIASLHKERNK